jgi:hypothetical protein
VTIDGVEFGRRLISVPEESAATYEQTCTGKHEQGN